MIKNMIGIEAEVFARSNETGEFVILRDDFPHDGVPILAEIRGDPAEVWYDAVGKFEAARLALMDKAARADILLTTVPYMDVTDRKMRKAIRNAIVKSGKPRNLYGEPDEVSSLTLGEHNRVLSQRFDAGLHIHFSSQSVLSYSTRVGGTDTTVSHTESRMSMPIISAIVRDMDKFYTDNVGVDAGSTYRAPGWFELKPYGFEYRSLPFSESVYGILPHIVKYASEILYLYTKEATEYTDLSDGRGYASSKK